MFENTDKRRLYWLIDECLAGRIDSSAFCDAFYVCYDLELDTDSLSEVEHYVFKRLSDVVSRFSQFEEDLRDHPGVYFSEAELQAKISDTRAELASVWGG